MTVAVGSLVGDRFRVGELLGRGGMADVHRAVDERLGREVALKVLRGHTASPADRERFAAEARLVAQLDHPYIVSLLDAGLDEDQPWLAMQLVDGVTLGSRLGGRPLPEQEVAQVGVQVAEALAYAHAQGVVHRDVKPGNVLIAPDGRALLADFGIARLLDSTARHTADGQAVGSPAYLAPEQAGAGAISGATDVYALGLVLLEALTGERAWRGTTSEIVFARLQGPPAVPDTLPARWRDLLEAMTRLDPEERPTAAEVIAALAGDEPVRHASAREAVDPEATAPFTPFTPVGVNATRVLPQPGRWIPARWWRSAIGAGLLLVVAMTALVLWLGLRQDTGTPESVVPPVPDGVPAQVQDELADLHAAIHGNPDEVLP